MADLPKVDLNIAYSWVCDACGQNNFVHGILMSHEQFADTPEGEAANEVLEEHNRRLDEAGGSGQYIGAWIGTPSFVTCPECKTKYEVNTDAETDEPADEYGSGEFDSCDDDDSEDDDSDFF